MSVACCLNIYDLELHSEEVSESHEAFMMIGAICEENKKHRLEFELVVSNPAKSRPPKGGGFDREDGK